MFPFLNKKEEPVKIHFVFGRERAAMKYLKAFRRLAAGTSKEPEADIVMFVARFMVDKNNQYLLEEKAIAILDELSPTDFKNVTAQFMEAVQERIVPKASGSDSTTPQEVGSR